MKTPAYTKCLFVCISGGGEDEMYKSKTRREMVREAPGEHYIQWQLCISFYRLIYCLDTRRV